MQLKFFGIFIAIAATFLLLSWQFAWFVWLFYACIPLLLLGIYDMLQSKRTLLRIYPLLGHFRFLLESIRPEIQQYFIEHELDGRPFSREFRNLVYQRAKGTQDNRPFGTQFDVYRTGAEWLLPSLDPKETKTEETRVVFGENRRQPYSASHLNISAMSFGSLSKNAILALNKGAKMGGFAHNTGEGGISVHHQKYGGDLVWQIGTGYFGCRTLDGRFCADSFAKKATLEAVKMIEIKLSQGAKPGHGGVLPARKLTPELAQIRGVPLGKDVVSPNKHSAFSSPEGLLRFVEKLRMLSGGKPIGFKLCMGRRVEFLAICKAMLATKITPDFITIDGSEGGTGAAPIELTNSVGMPLRDGLWLAHNALVATGLRNKIRIIASGKSVSAFHSLRLIALGADTINVARAMMFALGCIQARQCHQNTCPTGVATQQAIRYNMLNVAHKAQRVQSYHSKIIKYMLKLVSVSGLEHISDVHRSLIYRRCGGSDVRNYTLLYPELPANYLLESKNKDNDWVADWSVASAHSFAAPNALLT